MDNSMRKKAEDIPELTSIRGLAALIVVWEHVGGGLSNYGYKVFSLFDNGGLGVDMFFVLSGFIMAHVYGASPINNKRDFFSFSKHFLVSRLARIYPIHLVTLLVVVLLVVFLEGFSGRYREESFGVGNFVANLLLVHNWGFSELGWNMVSWSISAEWFMYLLFPVLILAATQLDLHLMYRAFLVCIALLCCHHFLIYYYSLEGYGGLAKGGMVRVFFEFILGFFVYKFREYFSNYRGHQNWYVLFPLILIVISLNDEELYYLFVPSVCILILHLSIFESFLAKFLRMDGPVWLGKISYSLYMWHWIILQLLNYFFDKFHLDLFKVEILLIYVILSFAFSLSFAYFSYRMIEFPARNFARKLAQ